MPRHSMHSPVRSAALACAMVAGLAGGCGSMGNGGRPAPEPESIDAIETRQIAAPRDAVLRAAATVLLDEGYAYRMSDHAAGLISGFRLHNDTMSAEYYARGGGMGMVISGYGYCRSVPPSMYGTAMYNTCPSAISDSVWIWVRPADRGRSLVRIQLWASNDRVLSEPEVTQFAALIEQRLMAEAPSASTRQATGGAR